MKGTYVDRTGQSKVSTEVTDAKKQKKKSSKDAKGAQHPLQSGLLPGITAPGAVVQNIVPNVINPPPGKKYAYIYYTVYAINVLFLEFKMNFLEFCKFSLFMRFHFGT